MDVPLMRPPSSHQVVERKEEDAVNFLVERILDPFDVLENVLSNQNDFLVAKEPVEAVREVWFSSEISINDPLSIDKRDHVFSVTDHDVESDDSNARAFVVLLVVFTINFLPCFYPMVRVAFCFHQYDRWLSVGGRVSFVKEIIQVL